MPTTGEPEALMSNANGEYAQRWYAIHTHPQQEDRAEGNLLSWGVETFVPRYKSRLKKLYRSRPAYSAKPLFMGYIFARLATRADIFHKIRYTRGVHSIVSIGKSPAALEDELVELMMSRLDEEGFVRLEDEMKSGDEVVVSGGVFGGFVGVFDRRTKNSERVIILLKSIYQFRVVVSEAYVTRRPAAEGDYAASYDK
jgi:transcriptional antiterminator RfaH